MIAIRDRSGVSDLSGTLTVQGSFYKLFSIDHYYNNLNNYYFQLFIKHLLSSRLWTKYFTNLICILNHRNKHMEHICSYEHGVFNN